MNLIEKEMLDILKSLKNDFGVDAIKAEFEAEGTRIDELLRLVELVRKCDLKLGIKIGGCEAMKDLMECKQIGVDYIIAPMVETSYALKKFIEAKNKIYSDEEKKFTSFLINTETLQTLKNMHEISEEAIKNKNDFDGFVFGRVDFSLSSGFSRDDINSEKVTNQVLKVSEICKNNSFDFVVGGGVSVDALPHLKKIRDCHLTRFETRKVIFSSDALGISNLDQGMLQAVKFELLWLKNKKNYYETIFKEDDSRIKMLSDRWKV